MESVLSKVAGLYFENLLKWNSTTCFFCNLWKWWFFIIVAVQSFCTLYVNFNSQRKFKNATGSCLVSITSLSESSLREVFCKNVFSQISQNSQENTCVGVSFLLKKRLWHRYFPLNFAKFVTISFCYTHVYVKQY